MFYVYILKSAKDKNLYLGYTENLKRRFSEDNKGLINSTKERRPFILVYYEAYKDEHEARVREKNLKLRANAFIQFKEKN